MTPKQAIEFVRYHGVVLESAKGLEACLVTRVVGAPVAGQWWAHPQGREIFALTRRIRASSAVLTCTLASGRITYVHWRLWPPFVKLADLFAPGALDSVRETHTAAGRHQRQDRPFPDWVPRPFVAKAKAMKKVDAHEQIGIWLQRYGMHQS